MADRDLGVPYGSGIPLGGGLELVPSVGCSFTLEPVDREAMIAAARKLSVHPDADVRRLSLMVEAVMRGMRGQ